MAHTLLMPRQGNTVESCILVAWKVAKGARVAADDVVCEVETDKATFEVPAGADGVVLELLHAEGDDVPVLEPIATIGAPGEEAVPAEVRPAQSVHGISPRARRLAAGEGVVADDLTGTGPGGRVLERDVRGALAGRASAAASPATAQGTAAPTPGPATAGDSAAELAARIRARSSPSARRAVSQQEPPPSAAGSVGTPTPATASGTGSATASVSAAGDFTETRLKGIRKVISGRMRASLATTAQVSFHGSAPAERLLALRARMKGSDPAFGLAEVTIGDLVLFAVSRVVPRFPAVNAHLVGEALRTFRRVHLGLAVDTPRGLLVPVVRDADRLSLPELSAEAKRLAAACQRGSISPDDLTGATFTVSNLGAFGVESFTPVLNAPEVGILGVNAITQRVAAGPGGAPVLEPRIGLSLTVDHQIVDGAPAARILKAFADAIAAIDLLVASSRAPGPDEHVRPT